MATTGIITGGTSPAPSISPTAGTALAAGHAVSPAETPVRPAGPAEPVDRVTLMEKLQEVQQERQQQKKEQQKEEAGQKHEPPRMMNDILFSYNFRGDLRIRFMDSVNKLVYQTPPVYFTRLADLMMSPRTSVDTKV